VEANGLYNDDDGHNMKIKDGLLLVDSSVTIATPKSKSVRTTIPEVIATHHRMKPGSTIVWAMDPKTGGVWLAEVDGRKVDRGK